jgi:hypothetical protein
MPASGGGRYRAEAELKVGQYILDSEGRAGAAERLRGNELRVGYRTEVDGLSVIFGVLGAR